MDRYQPCLLGSTDSLLEQATNTQRCNRHYDCSYAVDDRQDRVPLFFLLLRESFVVFNSLLHVHHDCRHDAC